MTLTVEAPMFTLTSAPPASGHGCTRCPGTASALPIDGQLMAKSTYLTLAQAAEYLGCTPKTLRRRIADGTLTGYRFGKRAIRIDRRELDALLTPIPTASAGR